MQEIEVHGFILYINGCNMLQLVLVPRTQCTYIAFIYGRTAYAQRPGNNVRWGCDLFNSSLGPIADISVMRLSASDVTSGNVLVTWGLREQKGPDRGRWVGAPDGCKQYGHIWAT